MSPLIVLSVWSLCGFAVMNPTSATETLKLSSGYDIPVVGLGTFLLDNDDVDRSVTTALETGYRLIDTAYIYKNEEAIGKALKKWFDNGGKREDLFVTTKLPPHGNTANDVEKYIKLSLEKLGLQYIDLYLIHVPMGVKDNPKTLDYAYDEKNHIILDYNTDLVAVWKAMEAQVKAGRARSIGISNFNETQVLKILKNAEIKPSNLQVELQIYHQQKPLRALCAKHNISVTAYSTLGSAGLGDKIKKDRIQVLEHPVVKKIAKAHQKTSGQVLLRHALQNQLLVIPKSKTPKRIKENFDVFDFSLSQQEIEELNNIDVGEDGRNFNFMTFIGVEKHPEYPFANELTKK